MGEGNYSTYVILAALVAAMWWMSTRTKKRQRAADEFRDNLAVGQQVMTGSGLFGTIVAVTADRITLRSGSGASASTSEWLRQAIAKVIEPDDVLPADEGDDAGVDDDTQTPTQRDVRGTTATDE